MKFNNKSNNQIQTMYSQHHLAKQSAEASLSSTLQRQVMKKPGNNVGIGFGQFD